MCIIFKKKKHYLLIHKSVEFFYWLLAEKIFTESTVTVFIISYSNSNGGSRSYSGSNCPIILTVEIKERDCRVFVLCTTKRTLISYLTKSNYYFYTLIKNIFFFKFWCYKTKIWVSKYAALQAFPPWATAHTTFP